MICFFFFLSSNGASSCLKKVSLVILFEASSVDLMCLMMISR